MTYYAILKVTPDAPAPVITASYKALMFAAKHHPDKGGDPKIAAILGEAYAVLSNPARRKAYDAKLAQARMQASRPTAPNPAMLQDNLFARLNHFFNRVFDHVEQRAAEELDLPPDPGAGGLYEFPVPRTRRRA